MTYRPRTDADLEDEAFADLARELTFRQSHNPCESGHTNGDGSWWAHDAQGIPLCRVCDKCEQYRLSKYRPEILTGYTQADVDEPIDPQ